METKTNQKYDAKRQLKAGTAGWFLLATVCRTFTEVLPKVSLKIFKQMHLSRLKF
jgi:hypothetical protein